MPPVGMLPPLELPASVMASPLAPTETLLDDMIVPFSTLLLANHVGDHRLVFNEPVLNSSSSTMVLGAPRLAGALGTAPLLDAVMVGMVVVVVVGVVVPEGDGVAGARPAATGVRVGRSAVPFTSTKV